MLLPFIRPHSVPQKEPLSTFPLTLRCIGRCNTVGAWRRRLWSPTFRLSAHLLRPFAPAPLHCSSAAAPTARLFSAGFRWSSCRLDSAKRKTRFNHAALHSGSCLACLHGGEMLLRSPAGQL